MKLEPSAAARAAHDHAAVLGEFDGVADQIDQNLTEAARVADDGARHVLGEIAHQLQALLFRTLDEEAQRVAHLVVEVERPRIEFEFARLDARDVEQVVDDRQQGLAGAVMSCR